MKRAFAVFGAVAAFALIALAGNSAFAQEKAGAPVPWIKLAGNDTTCQRIVVQIGGHRCVDWTGNDRLFSLAKDGKGSQKILTTVHLENQAERSSATERGGSLPSLELRALRTYLASIDVAHLQGRCDAFIGQAHDPFDAPANFALTWYGPNGASNTIQVGTNFYQVPCPKPLLRLFNRLNRLSATLPTKPQR